MNAPLRFTFRLAAALFAFTSARAATPDVVVAADGSAQYQTVRAAIDACPQITHAGKKWTILVKNGTYRELVYIQREKRFITVVGEDAEKTIISFDLFNDYPAPDGKPIATYRTPTVMLDADDFTFENITLENTAGSKKGQALAIRIDGDRAVFRKVRFLGWQDTILTNRGRHYFEDCYIVGATDFIFGGATVFFERCHIHCAGNGYITAASTPDFQKYGFVFSNCKITGETPDVKTFLGRPWRDYAQTIFLNCEMSDVVKPEGWNNWNKPYAEKVATYAEFKSTGPGATPVKRAAWTKQLTATEAANYSLEKVLAGPDGWNPTK